MITTTEAWYRWSDVLFWYQSMPEGSLERSALGALMHRDALASPSHPLREKGAAGINATIVTFACGRRALCLSLRQVQYLQHFVWRACFADGSYLESLHAAQVAGKSLQDLRPPSTPTVPPIPLPNHPVLASFVSATEQVTVNGCDMKKLGERIKKDNKRMQRDARTVPVLDTPPPPPVEEDTPPTPSSPALSSASSATLLADQALSDDEEAEEEPVVTDPDALPRPEPVGNAELYYRAHVALESASRRSFLSYYLQAQEPSAALAALPDWVGCGTFFSLVPNFVGDQLTDVALCTLSFPLDGDEVAPTRETRHFVIADAARGDSTPSPGQSETVHRADLADRIVEWLDDAWERGGGGARYFVKHPSERSDFADFPELGMDSNEWHSEMARDGGPLAPWTDPGAWGETFEVDIARLLEPMGTAAGVDLSARKPGELCGLFDLEPREAVSAAERAELLIELATSLLETPLNATYAKFLDRWAELQASFESTQKALRIATERAVAAAADQNPDIALVDESETSAPADGGAAGKPKAKKKKKKAKKKRKPKASAPTDVEEVAAPDEGGEAAAPNGGKLESEAETTTTEPTEDDESDDDLEPDFTGGVLIGRDGQLVEYVREL